jgi:hypothetical protein
MLGVIFSRGCKSSYQIFFPGRFSGLKRFPNFDFGHRPRAPFVNALNKRSGG